MRTARRTAFGLAAGATLCASALALAPAAHAGTGTSIKITHKGGFVATTCYEWLGIPDKGEDCNQAKAVGQTWTRELPEGTTSVVINLKLSPWDKNRDSAAVQDVTKNHCFEIRGMLGSEHLVETGC
ncbi:hypothetical protein CP973_35335 [Streptomyces albofaciens JCM 4342]|uniref:hypothetical protein n=1 Tax=Streptomyces albofaciens TaxID=66866 RepID=UPI00123AC4D2|nr:hypothetical protein [Streptomyces albofaciens]KAA6214376.1 hypothetical protein CP973_35335 [Streptomyces albofaciens JCM 4342]